MIQEPADAQYADMPRNALRATSANYVLDARAIGRRLASLVSEPVAEDPPDDEDYRRSIREQIELAASEAAADD